MKKILTILAILMVAFVARVSADDGVKWDYVDTAEKFYSTIKANSAANIKLTANIDLSGHSADDDCIFNFEFTGRIDGEYTTSRGFTYFHTLMNSSSDLLFNYLTGAEITNLFVYNCSFDAWDTHSGWFGTQAYNCTFRNVFMVNCSGTGDNTLFDNDYVGGAGRYLA